jgi:tRNA G18 (ribose-2'-O)-methylase SpoU
MKKVYHGVLMPKEIYVILDNVRSAHNVGSIFRTADGAGVSKIFLTGYTPTPIDRFGRPVAEIQKTSLGASESVPSEYHEDIFGVIADLKKKDVGIVAVEQTAKAVAYKQATIPYKKAAFIFGNEIDGISSEVCDTADLIIDVPMYGNKESLNVSVTAGIILFHARD